MEFSLNAEQTMLQEVLSKFLRNEYDFDKRRKLLAQHGGFASSIWSGFASSLPILGAALPTDLGGLDGGPVETMIIMEALGEALVLEPYLETAVLGAGLLKRCGSRGKAFLPSMVSGELRTAFAAYEPTARFALHDVSTTARREGDCWVLEGIKSVVIGAPVSTHLIVTARTSGDRADQSGISVFMVDSKATGLIVNSYSLIDGRLAADVRLNGVRLPANASLFGDGEAFPLIEQVVDEAIAAVCSEAVGGMRRMLQDTISFTKQRRQFGQPLASFQVLQHRMVNMYMALEQAVSATYLATLRLGADPVTRRKAVSAAKATIGLSGRMIGQSAVQLHGGMGVTEELAIGHYFRRATVIESQFGTTDYHTLRYAKLCRQEAPPSGMARIA